MKGFTGESRFYHSSELKHHLRELLEGATKVMIATAWISNSDSLTLLRSIAQSKKISISLVVGVGGYYTNPDVLRALARTEGIALKVFGTAEPPLFHPKLYIFKHQHWQRTLVGSMNFTKAGITKNLESVFSLKDKLGGSEQEFLRFWNSPSAIPFESFDIDSYEARRTSILNSVWSVGADEILDEDVDPSIELNEAPTDILRAKWQEFVAEFERVPNRELDIYKATLDAGRGFVKRDWSQEFSQDEFRIMFGSGPYVAFGNLPARVKQAEFQGVGNKNRLEIGRALGRALRLSSFSKHDIANILDSLMSIDNCKESLATRLLVLTRPDIFAVVTKKSFEGLQKRFGLQIVHGKNFTEQYVEVLEEIQTREWYRSPRPESIEQAWLWDARAAMIDPLIRTRHLFEVALLED